MNFVSLSLCSGLLLFHIHFKMYRIIHLFELTFLHLADAFIQSDLQLHSGYTISSVCVFQGRNHGIDIGGGPNVSPPPDIFFNSVADQIVKTNRPGHQRMNIGLSMEWEVRELLGLWLQQFIIQPNFRVSC